MEKNWWKESVVYQIYPRSFQDSNHDGIGDLAGILTRLDYLKKLGTDVVWLCPVYDSPNVDNGYDIRNYKEILDTFGTMEDFDRLLEGLHSRGMKLLMDLVVNHTSDQHEWFQQALRSRDDPYHDYYIWQDGTPDKLPNNWESHFSGSAWEYVPHLGQYYLHIFAKQQPDLNWKNPKVREAVKDICRFWLDKGVDGFRMDTMNFYSKVDGFPSVEGVEGLVRAHRFYQNGPHIHGYLKELYRDVLSQYNGMTVGETPNVTPEIAKLYTGDDRDEVNMLFQFEHMSVDSGPKDKWDLIPWDFVKFKKIMSKWQTSLHGCGWNSLYLSNHDQPRPLGRFVNDGVYRVESAKLLGTMTHTMEGTPYIYQGEELGMVNVRFSDIANYRDVQTLNLYKDLSAKGVSHRDIMRKVYTKGRDNARTPMQWNDERYGGFSDTEPWIELNPSYLEINAAQQEEDPNSVLHYYRKLIRLRRQYPVMVYGDFVDCLPEDPARYAYRRTLQGEKLFVLLNFKDRPTDFYQPEDMDPSRWRLLLSNYPADGDPCGPLRPCEARVFFQKEASL
ncbi:alpha-glucosidase [uncultured Oscillibacter sp.]|uniref:glycoside hydrolase family 13 protein n=1 Tax=uncultured Oscillibacter sp. TaxID=876091 RepID=UPI00262A9F68|nr:alpha-glucosidase [uncultured Oscillibacter sp.]